MSYEIVYDKQFIKLKDNLFVPMLFWGSNNCYEHSGRRARSWSVWTFIADGYYASKETLLANCEKLRQDKIKENKNYLKTNPEWDDIYNDKHFGYWTSLQLGSSTHSTTYGMFKGLFNTGCRKALTIEELKEEGITVSISSYCYSNEYKEKGIEPYSEIPISGDDFIQKLEEAQAKYKDIEGVSVHVRLNGASEHTMKWLRKRRFPRKKKEYKEPEEVNEFWTIVAPNGSYFVKKTKWGYRYTYYPYLKYKTEKEALKRMSNYHDEFKTELVKEKARI